MAFPSETASQFADFVRKIRLVESEAKKQSLLDELTNTQKSCIVSFINAHGMNLCVKTPAHGDLFMGADYLLRDGIGVKLLYKALDRESGLNMNGTDLIPDILKYFAKNKPNYSVALLGTESPYLDRAADKLKLEGHPIKLVHHGFEDESTYVELLKKTRCNLVVLAMGMPKQERVAERLRAELDYPCVIVNGGAILDFISVRFKRAPEWVRKANLEFVYRFMKEPKRLMKRTLGYGVFMWRVMRYKNKISHQL